MSGFSVGAGYCSEAIAFFNRLSTPLGASQAAILLRAGQYDNLFRSLVTAWVWPLLPALWVPAAADSTIAKLNLVSPAHSLTEVNSTAFVADRGYTGDGTTSYLSGPNLSSFSGLYTLNSAHMGIFVGTNVLETRSDIGSSISSAATAKIGTRISGAISGRMNDGTSTAGGTITNSIGHTCQVRAAADSYSVYKNGLLDHTVTVTTTSINNATMTICAGGNTYSTKQVSAAHVGSGALTTAQIGVIASSLATFMQSIGAPTS